MDGCRMGSVDGEKVERATQYPMRESCLRQQGGLDTRERENQYREEWESRVTGKESPGREISRKEGEQMERLYV